MSAKEYDLKASEDSVGQLYPVLLSKDGKVIDGLHRLGDDEDWRTETLGHIDDDEKFLLARCIANWHRRAVPRSEKEEWINGLAKVYQKQGYKTKGEPMTILYKGDPFTTSNQIQAKIVEVTGLSPNTVLHYTDEEFKQVTYPNRKSPEPTSSASDVIKSLEKSHGYQPGTLVERHREEVKEEVKSEVAEEVRREALEDPDFVVKAIEKAPEVLAKRRVPTVDREKYHVPTIDREARAEAEQVSEEVDEEIKAIKETPEIKEKSKLLGAWRALGVMLSQSEGLICPICNRVVTAYIRCPNCGDMPIAEAARVAKEAIE